TLHTMPVSRTPAHYRTCVLTCQDAFPQFFRFGMGAAKQNLVRRSSFILRTQDENCFSAFQTVSGAGTRRERMSNLRYLCLWAAVALLSAVILSADASDGRAQTSGLVSARLGLGQSVPAATQPVSPTSQPA